jgi:hypothetical protein
MQEVYCSHPEFDEFERFQQMGLTELLAIVEDRLRSEMLDGSMKPGWSAGLHLLHRLNG